MEMRTVASHMQRAVQQSGTVPNGRAAAGTTAGDMGAKMASKLAGDQVSFSKLLAREKEQHRKVQHLRHGPREKMQKVQHLYPGMG